MLSNIKYSCGCEYKLFRIEATRYSTAYSPEHIMFLCKQHSTQFSKAIRRDFNTYEAWDNVAP